MGMAAAAKLSRAEGFIPEDVEQKIIDLLRQYRLPVEIPPSLERTRILRHMRSDKKFVDSTPFFVLVKRIGEVFVYDKLGLDRVEAVLSDRH
jgi:3-dehydroquinate synthetase